MTDAYTSLKNTLGKASAQLPNLDAVPEPALADFAAAVAAARAEQQTLLQASAEHSLRLVPRLLRPVVRKVLFG